MMAMGVVESIYKLKKIFLSTKKRKKTQGKCQEHREFVINWSVATLKLFIIMKSRVSYSSKT